MNQDSKTIFKDSRETIVIYYTYFHLGYFYSQLSKKEDISQKFIWKPWIICSPNERYLLREDIIKDSLADIYKKCQLPDIFFNLISNNSVRGITMAVREALKDKGIRNLFLEYIFNNDEALCNNFEGVVRFIRNTFSHNMRDRIELKITDYKDQIKYLEKEKKSTAINFFFDYAKSPIPINRANYTVKIDIDFNQIKDGVVYTDVISEYQTLLFIELCYNCMEHIQGKLA